MLLFQLVQGTLEVRPLQTKLPRIFAGKVIREWISQWHFHQAASEFNELRQDLNT